MKDEKYLLEEHSGIMYAVRTSYLSNVLRRNSSPRILELAIKDMRDIIKATESEEVRKGFEKGLEMLTHLKNFPLDTISDPEKEGYYKGPVVQALDALSRLTLSCYMNGYGISDGRYSGRNPCRTAQYESIDASDTLNIGMLKREVPDTSIHLVNALNSYIEQCGNCPYRAWADRFEKKEKDEK